MNDLIFRSGRVVSNTSEQQSPLTELFFKRSSVPERIKPSYVSCWMMPCDSKFSPLAGYDLKNCSVRIGTLPSGEIEYRLEPDEYSYPEELNSIVCEAVNAVTDAISSGSQRKAYSLSREFLLGKYDDIVKCADTDDMDSLLDAISATVERNTVGPGVFALLLSDPHIEDIYVDAPCSKNRIHITINGVQGINSHIRCRTNLMIEDTELNALINILKRESGLRFCHSSPVLETDMPGFGARVTVMGYPMSPNGNALAIRKHSSVPWTLPRLIANGTITAETAGLLSFMVNSRTSVLIAGARGAGKSSLLSALMMEFPLDQRILTISDTLELCDEEMRSVGYKVQTILVDEHMQGDQFSRSKEALRVSLRMGESAIIIGEVRGDEAKILYSSMSTGKSGSSIMGTIHGDSAESVYNRVVNDMGVAPEAFNATDAVIVLKTVRNKENGHYERKLWEMKGTADTPGSFVDLLDSDTMWESRVIKRTSDFLRYGKDDLVKELHLRTELHRALSEAGMKNPKFFSPEWIIKANELVFDTKRPADLRIARFRAEIGLGKP